MNLADARLLADENIHPAVIAALRLQGRDVASASELGLAGMADELLLRRAVAESRVVLTHDRDFGRLALEPEEPRVGIIYLRPGSIAPATVGQMLDVLWRTGGGVEPPFVIVVERRADTVRVRVRRTP